MISRAKLPIIEDLQRKKQEHILKKGAIIEGASNVLNKLQKIESIPLGHRKEVREILKCFPDNGDVDDELSAKNQRAVQRVVQRGSNVEIPVKKQLYTEKELKMNIMSILTVKGHSYGDCVVPERTLRRYLTAVHEQLGLANSTAMEKRTYCREDTNRQSITNVVDAIVIRSTGPARVLSETERDLLAATLNLENERGMGYQKFEVKAEALKVVGAKLAELTLSNSGGIEEKEEVQLKKVIRRMETFTASDKWVRRNHQGAPPRPQCSGVGDCSRRSRPRGLDTHACGKFICCILFSRA